ncbi:MAG: helix-turn-helix domain-containing protein [Halioglobus sp.]
MIETIKQTSFHIEELSALQFGWHIDFTQLGPSKGKSAVSLIRSTNLGVCHFQFNANYDQRLRAQPGYYSFGLPDPETTGVTVHGSAANSGAIIVFPHEHEAYGASPSGFHGYGIQIRAHYFEAIAETIFQTPLRSLVPTAGVYALTDAQFCHLRWELQKWQHLAASEQPANESILAHRQEAMAIALLSGLSHSVIADGTQHLKSDRSIRLVLDYVNDSPSDEITAVELCTLADCSQRWLEQSFKARFGVTPKAYVKYLRLARLRQDLLGSSSEENQTVFDLASAYGFWHMGQLAADYRKVYGELPSATLKCG